MKKINRIYLILTILFALLGIVQCVRWRSSSGTITIGYLFNLLPAVAFFIAYVLSRKIKRKLAPCIVIPLLLLTLAAWGFVTFGVEMVISATTEVKNVKKYDKILDDYWGSNNELVNHFPRPIPADAQDVEFSFLPGFLQGGAHVQLRYSASPYVISELYKRFSGKKTKSFNGGNTNDHVNMKEGMPTTFFYTSGSKSNEFPNDYEIMIFDKILKEEGGPEGHYWNHGKSHGVVISKKRNEIIYWAESW